MKNTTRRSTKRKQLSDKTRWAYFMQAIEPKSDALLHAFPEYHPQWVCMSQAISIGGENFRMMRCGLGMTQAQCGAYLRVSERTVRAWENGRRPVPFAEFELLRVVRDSVFARLSHKDWDGWFIGGDGKLVSPDYGRAGFTPQQLNLLSFQQGEAIVRANALQKEAAQLRGTLNDALAQNHQLRELFLSQGVVDELYSMQDRLEGLVKQIATAHVIPFPAKQEPQKEKAA